MKLTGSRLGTDERKDYFTQNIINLQNVLPQNAVMIASIGSFFITKNHGGYVYQWLLALIAKGILHV